MNGLNEETYNKILFLLAKLTGKYVSKFRRAIYIISFILITNYVIDRLINSGIARIYVDTDSFSIIITDHYGGDYLW